MKRSAFVLAFLLAAACNRYGGPPIGPFPSAHAAAQDEKPFTPRANVAGVLDVYAATRAGMFSDAVKGIPERVYVPDSKGTTVTVIDPATFKVLKRIDAGLRVQHIAPAWDLSTLYAEAEYTSSLTELDPLKAISKTVFGHITDPYNMYFTPDGSKAIIVAEAFRRLDFRDPHTFALIKSVRIPWPGVDHMDFTADGRYVLASTEYSGIVVKVDVVAMKVVGSLRVGGRPIDVRLSPDGSVFYVANQGLGGVSVVDPVAMKQVEFIPTGIGAHGFAVSRDGTALYVTNRLEGTISVIRFSDRRVIHTWHVGGSPDMLQVSPDGSQLWTSNRFNGTVTVVSARDGSVLKVIRVGGSPHGLTYFPQPGRISLGHNGVYR